MAVLDPTDGDASGTGNNNGKLEPGDIALASPGSVSTASVTDATHTQGTALFTVNYPEDHAMWVTSTLTATATAQGPRRPYLDIPVADGGRSRQLSDGQPSGHPQSVWCCQYLHESELIFVLT